MRDYRVHTTWIDHIPALWIEPAGPPRGLAIWLPWLSGSKERLEPYLRDLASAGYLALSYDPWQHGERGAEPGEHLAARVFGNFRRHMWPILGQSALDALRVIDWAMARFDLAPEVRMGGISMGGDIAVAAAGIDPRIRCVAAIVATPDWLRPGMQDLRQPGVLLPPGEPDAYARFFYDQFNPLTHLAAYAGCPAITFECGARDTHVPPDGALRFAEALRERYPSYGDRLRVTLHPGIGHDGARPELWRRCLEWFACR